MASEGLKSPAIALLVLNLIMYVIVAVIAGWAINYGIDETPSSLSGIAVPAKIFPIYFPIGNLATGFFVILALITGVVGVMTSLSGLQEVSRWRLASVLSAGASSILTWALTLLTMGLACKEISIGWRPASLRVLEGLTIILTATQLLCAGVINAGASAGMSHY
ncbi:hypothetical protein LUZ60_003738 [Juncus effusus]|nr:hypothetical protein LUZ60_003738 [Juncus effusus]